MNQGETFIPYPGVMPPDPCPALTHDILGAAIKVHKALGPGLLEKVYHQYLSRELQRSGLPFAAEIRIPVVYDGLVLDHAYTADIIVDGRVLVELKAVESITPVHLAQTLTYLRLSSCAVALLINFNVRLLKDGIRRFVHEAEAGDR